MKGLLAIAGRELVSRKAVLGAAAFAALIPLCMPLLPSVLWASTADVRGAAAGIMALGLSWILAVFLGSSMIAGDLGQDRLGFYFSRPVSGLGIWLGKLIATWLVVVAAEIVVLLPSALLPASREQFFSLADEPWWVLAAVFFGLPLLLILVAHALGVIFRARTLWLALDAAACLVVVLAGWSAVAPLVGVASLAVFALIVILLLAALVALAVAGGVQVVVGRVDLRRAHAALSITLWTILLVAAFAVLAYSHWITTIGPEDLNGVAYTECSPGSSWIAVSGDSWGRYDYQPRLLLDLASGAYLSLPSGSPWWGSKVSFSGDGRAAAWCVRGGGDSWQLVHVNLASEDLDVAQSQLVFRERPEIQLSDDGSTVFLAEERSVSLVELESGRALVTARAEDDIEVHSVLWTSEERARLVVEQDDNLDLLELRADGLHTISTFGEAGAWSTVVASNDTARLYVGRKVDGQWLWSLHDGFTGEVVADFGTSKALRAVYFLENGHLLRGGADEGQTFVQCFSPQGELQWQRTVAKGVRIVFSGLNEEGRLMASVDLSETGAGSAFDAYQPMAVDLDSGEVDLIPAKGYPAAAWELMLWGKQVSPAASRLLVTGGLALVQWDPKTDEVRQVIAGRS